MKRIAIGAEPPPIKMVTFIAALESPQQGMLQRWWFTPDYKCVKLSADSLAAEFVGQGVQLQAEDKLIGADGSLAAAGGAKPNKASELFTLSFTRKYPEISAASQVYAQLRTLIDLAIAAALIRRHDYYAKSGWSGRRAARRAAIRRRNAACAEAGSLRRQQPLEGLRLLTPAGGGISIRPDEALDEGNLLPDEKAAVALQRLAACPPADAARWWWD